VLPFAYVRADAIADAIRATGGGDAPPTASPGQFLAGGTQLLDLMKLGTMQPERLVDINGLPLAAIEAGPQGLKLGALARMSEVETHAAVRRDYPVIAQTMAMAASQQLRNMATLAGNVLQRTRCPYFRDPSWAACNKRAPGTGCAALEGNNRKHAVLGASDNCIAAYPGDFAQALVALGATVQTTGPSGVRQIPFEQLHTGPEDPHRETMLQPGELITAFLVPSGPWTRRSTYVKIRDRESYAFALASAAVALDLRDGAVQEARIGLGGVAYKPWRAHAAEDALRGKLLDEGTAADAARAAFAGARPRGENAYKVELGRRTLVRALLQAAKMEA
jgi:xanthine dehydrogenase YagS FAD-binding subunit